MADLVIRPSGLTSWNDCARRGFASMALDRMTGAPLAELMRLGSFDLKPRDNGVGAAVGSGVHAGAAYTLNTKMETGEIGNDNEAEDRAVEEFQTRTEEEGVIWDQTTRDRDTAKRQISRMTRTYRRKLAPELEPVIVERRLQAVVDDTPGQKCIVSGQPDTVAQMGEELHDLKTGVQQRANGAQYGCYGMVARAHGYPVDVFIEDFIKRVNPKNDQPDPTAMKLLTHVCEQLALDTINDIRRSIAEFESRLAHGNAPPEGAFRANPLSMMCSDRYCAAHSTPFCRSHLPAKEK